MRLVYFFFLLTRDGVGPTNSKWLLRSTIVAFAAGEIMLEFKLGKVVYALDR